MSVDLTLQTVMTAVETLTGNAPFAGSTAKRVTHSSHNQSLSLTASTTVPVSMIATKTLALSGGAATIDLTALTGWGTNGTTLDATGLKLQAMHLKATTGNTGAITLFDAVSNGYEFLGADWKIAVKTGQFVVAYGADGAPDVGSGAKGITLSGTGTESIDIVLIFG